VALALWTFSVPLLALADQLGWLMLVLIATSVVVLVPVE
jgi:hypothetical protein